MCSVLPVWLDRSAFYANAVCSLMGRGNRFVVSGYHAIMINYFEPSPSSLLMATQEIGRGDRTDHVEQNVNPVASCASEE